MRKKKSKDPYHQVNPGTEYQLIRHIGDWAKLHKSFVVPYRKDKAFRFGFTLDFWAFRGPRRYSLVATERFVEDFASLSDGEPDIEGAKETLKEFGVSIQGDLEAEPEPDDG